MGLHPSDRRTGALRQRLRRPMLAVGLGVTLLVLTSCSTESREELGRLYLPEPTTTEGESILNLWQGAWIAAWLVGLVVWGLIFWAAWTYRRRGPSDIPIQTRYNLPLEIFYTIFPVIMVIVLFSHTVRVQNAILDDSPKPDNTITVVGQQWSWTFNYPTPNGRYVYEAGTPDNFPTLVIPVNETTRFELRSPDVIHSFGIPALLMRMDVIPGQDNHYQVTPKVTGTYRGRCYELCGVYHARMLFDVKVVSRAEYEANLQRLQAAGSVSKQPVLGGAYADTQIGLNQNTDAEEQK